MRCEGEELPGITDGLAWVLAHALAYRHGKQDQHRSTMHRYLVSGSGRGLDCGNKLGRVKQDQADLDTDLFEFLALDWLVGHDPSNLVEGRRELGRKHLDALGVDATELVLATAEIALGILS
jgi:hypothetical protein